MSNIKHNMKHTKTYECWNNMRNRANGFMQEKQKKYYVGIGMCDRWRDFLNFLSDMGEQPKGYMLDRIDNSKEYCKDNCRWINKSHSAANTIRRNRKLPRGVHRSGKKYQARIRIKGISNHLGTFSTIDEASLVYIKKYQEVYGELPPENRLAKLDLLEKGE